MCALCMFVRKCILAYGSVFIASVKSHKKEAVIRPHVYTSLVSQPTRGDFFNCPIC